MFLLIPFTLKVRYIGRTRKENLNYRLLEHISKSKYHKRYKRNPSHRYNWINSILERGKRPHIRKLCEVEGWKRSHLLERQLISKYKDKRNLVNKDDKGAGSKNKYISNAQKQSISETLKKGYSTGRIKSKSKKKTYVYNLEGDYLTCFNSAKEACEHLGLHPATLVRQVKGKCLQARGYRFSYTKLDRLPDISSFKKPVSYKVELHFKNGDIKHFSSMNECYDHYNITGGSTKALFANKLYDSLQVKKVLVNDSVVNPSAQNIKVSVKYPDGTIRTFSSLRLLGEHFNIHKGKCSINKLKQIFSSKRFNNYQLILDKLI